MKTISYQRAICNSVRRRLASITNRLAIIVAPPSYREEMRRELAARNLGR